MSIPRFAFLMVFAFPCFSSLRAGSAFRDGNTVVFLGDSITRNGAVPPDGFIRIVERELAEEGIAIKVVPAGIGGQKSPQMLARLQADVLDRKPDWLVLSCGVNDVWHGTNGVGLDDYLRNVSEIVARAQTEGVRVLVLTATLIGEDPGNALNLRLDSYNEALRKLAREKGCLLADGNAAMRAELLRLPPAPGSKFALTVDGVHLNAAGNRILATEILAALRQDAP